MGILSIDNSDNNGFNRFKNVSKNAAKAKALKKGDTAKAKRIEQGGTLDKMMKNANTFNVARNPKALERVKQATPKPKPKPQSNLSMKNILGMGFDGAGSKNYKGGGFSSPAPSQENSDLLDLINQLQAQSEQGFTYDSKARDDEMINQIFGAQLAQIASAKDQTNQRFGESTENTKRLYNGHVNEIRTKDKAEYQGIANQATSDTNSVFDGAIAQTQNADKAQNAEMEEMLARLGQQSAAPQAAQMMADQQKTINDLVQTKAAQGQQNNTYAEANQTRNDERAQSIADESVSKQHDLSRQLQDILGELGNKEADINGQKAQAGYQAYQNAEDNWRQDRSYATDALGQLMKLKADEAAAMAEAQAKSQESGGMNGSQMTTILNGLGIQDPSLQQKYSSAYTDAILNSNYTPGVQDQQTQMLKYLRDNNKSGLDINMLRDLVSSNLNYGTYKPGTPMK